MTPRIASRHHHLALAIGALVAGATFAACDAAVPQVSGKSIVLPSRSPNKTAQALDAPSTTSADSGSESQAFCLGGGFQTINEQNEDGSFVTEFACEPGGGIATVRNEGQIDPVTGDGAYDQITTFEDGGQDVWHFDVDTSDDGLTQSYDGSNEDGSETVVSSYAWNELTGRVDVDETWVSAEGTYVIDGSYSADYSDYQGTTSFDDPATERSPDWSYDEVRDAEGNTTQTVSFVDDDAGYSSDYVVVYSASGETHYEFSTDLHDTLVAPDFDGSYDYAADGTGAGEYTEHFEDGSSMLVSDVFGLDFLDEGWVFDDIETEQDVDQEGSLHFSADGSAEGSVTTHVVGGDSQTCDVHISADGVSTIDNCR